MNSKHIRQAFVDFFKERGHTFVPSAPIFPKDDPSLLFTNAGMNQFKNIFLGIANERNLRRAANSQKCMRVSGKHNDLEEVGRDHHHHTFFEMLGNWSFGDYYKKEAITWAWELLTKVWKLSRERLYVTVYTDDAEAEALWKSETDVLADHISRLKENFWEMGDTGPCGYCSEIHIDRGQGHCVNEHKPGHVCGVGVDGCGRFVELWNLVFMQNNKDKNGVITELPNKNIDTGMGFERLLAVLEDKRSNYDTDVFSPIIRQLEKMSGKTYGHGDEGIPFRVIADHIRALSFAIADGALPSNLGRGYVLRRVLRRAYRFGRKLGFHGPFLHQVVPTVVSIMGDAYPELAERSEFVQKILLAEEQSFEKTLDKGLILFEEISRKASGSTIAGRDVFMLYDTYGFPPDLTAQLAGEAGLTIDQHGFENEMAAQRERARGASKFKDMAKEGGAWTIVSEGLSSQFIGYDALSCETRVRKVRKTSDGCDLVLEQTPFYPEGGGQCGDTGIITTVEGPLEVYDTRREGDDIVHKARSEGEFDFSSNAAVSTQVDAERRADIRRNHTATHIIQTALRQAVGSHVKQSGSSVAPDRFRFDFTHFHALTDSELSAVEKAANAIVLADLPVVTELTSPEAAQAKGALAFFNEKYGDSVRMVSIPGSSVELCGGTHAARTGEIGYIRIVSESSVSSGIRRIEATTGRSFGEQFRQEAAAMRSLALSFKAPFDKVPSRVTEMGERIRSLEKELAQVKQQQALKEIDAVLAQTVTVKGVRVVRARLDNTDKDTFAQFCDALAARAGSAVTTVVAVTEGRVMVFAAVSDDLVASKKLNAGAIVNKVAAIVGGKGGGKPNRAQAGGKDAAQAPAAFDAIVSIVEGMV